MSLFTKCFAGFFFLDGTAILALSLIYGSEWYFDTSSYVLIGIIVLLAYACGIGIIMAYREPHVKEPKPEPPIEEYEFEAFHKTLKREPINYN